MDLINLKTFIAIAEHGSFSAAAARLHLTQPAVSKRVATLEQTFHATLFDRIGRQVKLTEAGRELLPRAQRILAELEDGRRALSNLGGSVSGRLSIATSHHIGLHRLPPLLRTFVSRYPQVQLDMRFTDSELGCEAVARGEVELAIVTLPQQHDQATIICVPVWDDPLAVVVNDGHSLAQRAVIGAPLRPAELARYPAIAPGEITFTRRLVDQFFQAHRLSLSVAFSTNYLETIKMMVAVGLGWSVLPRSMLDEDLTELDVAGFAVSRSLGAVHHPKHTLSNAARRMLDMLTPDGV